MISAHDADSIYEVPLLLHRRGPRRLPDPAAPPARDRTGPGRVAGDWSTGSTAPPAGQRRHRRQVREAARRLPVGDRGAQARRGSYHGARGQPDGGSPRTRWSRTAPRSSWPARATASWSRAGSACAAWRARSRRSVSPASTASRTWACASGLQCAVIEFARNVCGLRRRTPRSSTPPPDPVIDLLPEQDGVEDMGGTMRLGWYPADLSRGPSPSGVRRRRGARAAPAPVRGEPRVPRGPAGPRHGVLGHVARRRLVEIIELPAHPYFVAGQFHPELKSRPTRPHPLFRDFIGAARWRGGSGGKGRGIGPPRWTSPTIPRIGTPPLTPRSGPASTRPAFAPEPPSLTRSTSSDGRRASARSSTTPAPAPLSPAPPGARWSSFVSSGRPSAARCWRSRRASSMRPGRNGAGCAARELLEETGIRVVRVDPLATIFTSPGFADERIELFRARASLEPEHVPEAGIEVVVPSLEAAVAEIRAGTTPATPRAWPPCSWRPRPREPCCGRGPGGPLGHRRADRAVPRLPHGGSRGCPATRWWRTVRTSATTGRTSPRSESRTPAARTKPPSPASWPPCPEPSTRRDAAIARAPWPGRWPPSATSTGSSSWRGTPPTPRPAWPGLACPGSCPTR